jgi:superfamily II helicase
VKTLKNLEIQASIEGETENIRILRKIAKTVKYQSEFSAFVNVKYHRYGILSYQAHVFYYLKDYMRSLLSI